jgi:pimeloyl-ACP methyl ester carboxylesterase
MDYASRFKTTMGAEKYLAAYQATLALWPVPPQTLEVTTSFGLTHVNVLGSAELPPLLLLHGFGVSSTQWYPNIGWLSGYFRVYAPDMIGHMGLGVATRPLQTPQDCSTWLIELMDALNIERAAVGGLSQGGWLTLNLALAAPHRVERMVLLSPSAAFAPITRRFFLRLIPVLFIPTQRMIYWFLQWTTTRQLVKGDPLIEQMVIGMKGFKPQEMGKPIFSVYTDEELGQVTMPTLLLVGEHEVIYKPNLVLERARRLMPQVEAELIAGGGHMFPVDQAEATNARILKFLTG